MNVYEREKVCRIKTDAAKNEKKNHSEKMFSVEKNVDSEECYMLIAEVSIYYLQFFHMKFVKLKKNIEQKQLTERRKNLNEKFID